MPDTAWPDRWEAIDESPAAPGRPGRPGVVPRPAPMRCLTIAAGVAVAAWLAPMVADRLSPGADYLQQCEDLPRAQIAAIVGPHHRTAFSADDDGVTCFFGQSVDGSDLVASYGSSAQPVLRLTWQLSGALVCAESGSEVTLAGQTVVRTGMRAQLAEVAVERPGSPPLCMTVWMVAVPVAYRSEERITGQLVRVAESIVESAPARPPTIAELAASPDNPCRHVLTDEDIDRLQTAGSLAYHWSSANDSWGGIRTAEETLQLVRWIHDPSGAGYARAAVDLGRHGPVHPLEREFAVVSADRHAAVGHVADTTVLVRLPVAAPQAEAERVVRDALRQV